MNRKQQFKLGVVLGFIIILSTAIGLVLYALKQNINLFYTPTELEKASVKQNQAVKLGGYVKNHSVDYQTSGQQVNFIVTDRVTEIPVQYSGVLPNLFREGQTVVVTGHLNAQHILIAERVLAKHDEKYMPKALANQLAKDQSDVR